MNISLENWLRNKLQEHEEMHDYAVATEAVRCWMDEYKQLGAFKDSERSKQIACPSCKGENVDIMHKSQSFKCKDCNEGWAN